VYNRFYLIFWDGNFEILQCETEKIKEFFLRILPNSSWANLNIHIKFFLPNKKYILLSKNYENIEPLIRFFKLAFHHIVAHYIDTPTRISR
jgi:hypothetical protein